MTNSNCLEGIACPKCGNDSLIYIETTTLAAVTDDGAETFGDMEWDADSYAECPECGHRSILGEFRIPTDNDNATQTSKE
jgi:DNA-directed RNA polymerase subunit RPC12/RpoP